LDGRAIWIGNDAAVFIVSDLLRVDFGYHQRDVGLHTETGRVIDDHRTCIYCYRSELGAHATACGEEPDIDLFERIICENVDPDLFPLKSKKLSGRSLGGQEPQFAHRKLAFLQRLPHLLAHGAGGTHDCNIVVLFFQ